MIVITSSRYGLRLPSQPQVGQHRLHPTVDLEVHRQVELREDAVDVLGHSLLGDVEGAADGGVGPALGPPRPPPPPPLAGRGAPSPRTSRSLAVSRSSGSSRCLAMTVATTSGSSTVPPASTRCTPSTNSRTSE